MPASKARGSVATTRLRRVECWGCDYTIRVTRKWMAVGLPMCPCGQQMHCDDAYREAIEEREWAERYTRAAEREARAGHGGLSYEERATCEWCGSFVSHPGADCRKCGHRPDPAIGHRNIPTAASRRCCSKP